MQGGCIKVSLPCHGNHLARAVPSSSYIALLACSSGLCNPGGMSCLDPYAFVYRLDRGTEAVPALRCWMTCIELKLPSFMTAEAAACDSRCGAS